MVVHLGAIMSTGSMDITEAYRTDDITKTDFFDFVAAPDTIGIGINDRVTTDTNGTNIDAPLQGFDQFWGAEKDANRFESNIFEDLNRYCWSQQNNSSDLGSQPCNTDGQIYTLTVLNGNEPWLLSQQQDANMVQRKVCDTTDDTHNAALDFDSLLNTFPGYIKTEYTYDDSGFSTDNKDDLLLSSSSSASSVSNAQQSQQPIQVSTSQQSNRSHPPPPSIQTAHSNHQHQHQQQSQQQQQQHQHQQQSQHHQQQQQQQQITVTNGTNLNMNPAFHNNNNDWQMADHNIIVEDGNETPESLLRSALQGKGYAKGIQNSVTVIPSINSIKSEGNLRRAIFSTDAQTTLTFADSTLNAPLFDESHAGVAPNSTMPTTNHADAGETNVMVDDMFLALDSTFTDDFEKMKRIASDVQQFCIASDDFSEIITEVAIPQPNAGAIVTTTVMPQQDIVTSNTMTIHRPSTTTSKTNKSPKKYKRSPNHNNNNNNINMNNNNLTNSSNGNMGLGSTMNGQRKERLLHYCSICSKGFKDKYSVNVHLRTHTGEKPFACSLCGKSFRQKAHLAKHYQTHLAQKSTLSTKASKQAQQAQAAQSQLNSAHNASPAILVNGPNIMR